MLDKLKALLSGEEGSGPQSANLPDEPVAVTAILLEAAEADQTVDPEEHDMIVSMLSEHYALDQAEVKDLIERTQQHREKSVDLWPFTRAISTRFSPEKKRDLLVMVWQVVFADGRLDPYEEQLTRRLQSMLSVNHSLIIEAKTLARQKTGG